MKKIITVVLICLVVLNCVYPTKASYGEDTNDPKVTALVLSAFLGDPIRLNSPIMNSNDCIDSRYMSINPEDRSVIAMIRISETEMYVWQLELNGENLIKAELILDEKAPVCIAASFEGDEVKDYALYIKDDSAGSSYKSFIDDVERITKSLSSGSISSESDTEDPILSCFSGVSWNMTRDELLKTIDNVAFTRMDSKSEDAVAGTIDILGETVTMLFGLKNNKLSTIWAIIGENESDAYLSTFKEVYGDPHITTYANAFMGKVMDIKDDPNGDCYAWKTDKSLIIMQTGRIEYSPLY